MTDLSKIDFTKCKLPEFEGASLTVDRAMYLIEQVRLKNGSMVVATKTTADERHPWRMHEAGAPIADWVRHVLKCMELVDAFIVFELERIEFEEEFPLSSEQVRDFLREHPGEHRLAESWHPPASRWFRFADGVAQWQDSLGNWCGGALARGSRYRVVESRRPAPDWNYRVDLRTVPDRVALYEPDWVEVFAHQIQELDQLEVSTRYRKSTYHNWICRLYGGYAPDGYLYQADRNTFPAGYVPSFERFETKTADELLRMAIAKPGQEFSVNVEAHSTAAFFSYSKTKGLCLRWDTPTDTPTQVSQAWFFSRGPYRVRVEG